MRCKIWYICAQVRMRSWQRWHVSVLLEWAPRSRQWPFPAPLRGSLFSSPGSSPSVASSFLTLSLTVLLVEHFIKGITQYVFIGGWLLLLSVLSVRRTHYCCCYQWLVLFFFIAEYFLVRVDYNFIKLFWNNLNLQKSCKNY